MADLIFNVASKRLTWPAKGKIWKAVSGPYNRSVLPAGLYVIERRKITQYTSVIGRPFKDKSGKGFFLPITPQMCTGRNGLGIHPDGNKPGTEGCIGLKNDDTSDFYNAIKALSPGAHLTLEVQ